MYKLQIHQGSYDPSKCLDERHLIKNLLLKPEIMETLIFQNQGYTLNFLTHGLGYYAGNRVEKSTHQKALEWSVQGRNHRAVAWVRHISGDGARVSGSTGGIVKAVCRSNNSNPNDVIKLANGQQVIQIGPLVPVADGYQGNWRLKLNSASDTVAAAEFANGKRGGVIGNNHPAKSKQGYSNVRYPDRYKNWHTISRSGIEFDNENIMGVTWLTNPVDGSQLWCLYEEWQAIQKLLWEMEQAGWEQQMNTIDDGETWLQDAEGKDIVAGAGYIQQVAGVNSDTYIPGQDDIVSKLKGRINAMIIDGSGLTYDKVVVHTGRVGGATVWHNAMEDDFNRGFKTLYYSATAKKAIEVGEQFPSYSFNGITAILAGNMLFEDREIHTDSTFAGAPARSFDFFFINHGDVEGGNPNVCVAPRKSPDGKIDRSFVIKNFAGMISPYADARGVYDAVTSEDSFRVEALCEKMVCVFDITKTAQLRAVAAA